MAVLAILAVTALIQCAPQVLALARAVRHQTARPGSGSKPSAWPTSSASAEPPADWNLKGSYLSAAQAHPSVVEVLDSNGSPFCSGAVVHSPGADLVITAAHCVYASGAYASGLSVAPGATGGHDPNGTWNVDRAWVDPRYTQGDERYDYAFLRVSRPDGTEIEDAVGGDTLAVNQPFDLEKVTTTGYPDTDNPGDQQLTCTMDIYQALQHQGYREMICGGFYSGVSGAPWVEQRPGGGGTGSLIGIIGGWNGGGPSTGAPHEDAISFSPYFTSDTMTLYQQAVNGDGGQDMR